MGLAAIIVAVLAAGIGAWAAWSAHQSALSSAGSADEARRMRLDNLGPQVFIDDPTPLRERWNVSPGGDADRHPPGIAPPGRSFESPGNDGVRLLIGAILRIKNEGSISTRISMTGTYRIDTPLVLDTDEVDRIVREGKPQPDTRLPQSGITIEPGASMEIVVRAGPTLREWIDQGEHPCWIHIRAVTSPEAAAQEWELVLSGQLLNQNFSSASRFDVLAHTLIDTQLVSLPRAYPANLG